MAGLTAEAYHGIFLDKIVKEVTETIPYFGIIQDKKKITDAERIGEKFVIPINLQLEQGATYKKSNSGAYTLEDAVDGKVEVLTVNGSQISLRSKISTEAISSSQTASQAMEQALSRAAKNNSISHKKRLELALIHGQKPLAVVESVASAAVTFTEASFCPAMFAGMKGAKFEFFATDYSAKRDVGTPDYPTLVSVNSETRTVTFDGAANVVATDVLQFKGAVVENATPSLVVWHEMAGLRKIFSTLTGSPFGLDIAAYDVLKPVYSSGASEWLTYKKLMRLRSKILDNGAEEPNYVALMPQIQLEALLADEDAKRAYDSSYKRGKAEAGFNGVSFAAVGEGTIDCIAHPYMLPGEVLMFSWDDIRRPGAQEFTFRLDGAGGNGEGRWENTGRSDSYIVHLTDTEGHQIKSYSHGCIFHDRPSHAGMYYDLKTS